MSNRYLVQYGNYILSNQRFGVNAGDHYSSVVKETQYQPGARSSGATVLNTRNKERAININGVLRPNNGDLNLNIEDLDYLFGIDNQIFRIAPHYQEIFVPTATTNFATASDATNLGLDSRDIQISSCSITFDVDVSLSINDYAELTYTAASAVDLSAVTNKGNFEFALKIPDAQYITSVEFRVGNDASNYYSKTFTTDYQGNQINYGWSYFSVPWGNGDLPTGQDYESKVSETGSVNDAQIDYMYIKINYTSDATDKTGLAFGGCVWVDESKARNFPSFLDSEVRKNQVGGQQNSLMQWSVRLINYSGYSRATHEVIAYEQDNINSTFTHTTNYLGNDSILPKTTLEVISVTALTQLSIQNARTGEQVNFLPASVTAGDFFQMGGLNKIFTNNGTELDRTGVIPTYEPGWNATEVSFLGGSPVTYTKTIASPNNISSLGDDEIRVAVKFLNLTNGVFSSAFFTADGEPGSYGTIEVWSDNGGTTTNSKPSVKLDETALIDVGIGGTNNTFSGMFQTNVAAVSGTLYWIAFAYSSGPSGSTANTWNMNGLNLSAAAVSASFMRFDSIGTWSKTEPRIFEHQVTIAASLVGSLDYKHYYYPMYK